MIYSTELVIKVNKLYHDFEGQKYDQIHPEIFIEEVDRWQKNGRSLFVNHAENIKILDIGSGTGFVPLQTAQWLKKGDWFVCSDVSSKILAICKQKVLNKGFVNKFRFFKFNGFHFGLQSNFFDFITMNSVLHHIPNFPVFFCEIDRLLKTDGRLIIGHEPNYDFFSNKLLWKNYHFFNLLFHPKFLVASLLKKIGLYRVFKTIWGIFFKKNDPDAPVVEYINKLLLRENDITIPLTAKQIAEIVDIHSPTAGGFRAGEGIEIKKILKKFLANYSIDYFETYNHLYTISHKNRLLEFIDAYLKEKFPESGANFFIILKKQK